MGIKTALAALRRFAPKPSAFDKALPIILKHEGGYIHHPQDPGGRTNLGVTQRVWEAWVGRSVTEAEMRALTPAMVAPLYRKEYWDKLRCDDLPPGVALCVFDFGVNAGPARAARYLQNIVGAVSDGKIGPATINAVNQYVRLKSTRDLIRAYSTARRGYYQQLRTFKTFGRGWLRRTDEVEEAALKL